MVERPDPIDVARNLVLALQTVIENDAVCEVAKQELVDDPEVTVYDCVVSALQEYADYISREE